MIFFNRLMKGITFILCVVLIASGLSSSHPAMADENSGSEDSSLVKEESSQNGGTEDTSDLDGIKVTEVSSDKEMRGVWISFLEFDANGYTKSEFTDYIDKVFDHCVSLKLNTVFVHVRPFADAMYKSSYYPWSKYASGKEGKNPGYDPLEYMVKAAHKRNLDIHAWINPYRISSSSTDVNKLVKTSYAYKWSHSSKKNLRRNVLVYAGKLYFNPSSKKVQKLITNGVKEIVKNYDVDGIHFDDYFYPNMGSEYKKVFDAKEYNQYVKRCKKNKTSPLNIVKWRRKQVNTLVKNIYSAVKKIDSDCVFGISPAGNLDNLYLKCGNYVDVKTWMGNKGYIDYICPQIYWSFTQQTCPYKETVTRWATIKRVSSVKMYIGLASYRAGITYKEAKTITDVQWSKSSTILKRQLNYLRKKELDGFVLFSYTSLTNTSGRAAKEIKNFVSLLK